VGNDSANQTFQAEPPLRDNHDLAAVQAFSFVKKKLTINKTFLT